MSSGLSFNFLRIIPTLSGIAPSGIPRFTHESMQNATNCLSNTADARKKILGGSTFPAIISSGSE